MSESGKLDVKLMGRDYRVACEPGQREQLEEAVRYLDGKLREIAERTRASGERLAVMAALNIAHELLVQKSAAGVDIDAVRRRIGAVNRRLDDALSQQEQLF
jgi:cell division protein ZapA